MLWRLLTTKRAVATKPKKKPRLTKQRKHYLAHREDVRQLVHAKIDYWNQYYGFKVGTIRIKMHKSRWGSCSSKGNLNFNYKILFLPEHLQDYIIVHELCHLGELNHSSAFWALVAKTLPEYKTYVHELRELHISVQ